MPPSTPPRTRLRRLRWSFLTWLIVGLVVPTLILGSIGYWRLGADSLNGPLFRRDMQASPGCFGRLLDVVYDSLCLLWLGAKNTYQSRYVMVGRWFGVAIAFLTVLKLASARMERWLRDFRVAHLGRHTVVIGLGVKGTAFVRAAALEGPVVALDQREKDAGLLELGDLPHPVFVSKATVASQDDHALGSIGLDHAASIVLTTGDDAVNLAIARRLVHRLGPRPGRPVEILTHVSDAGLRVAGLSDVAPPPGVTVRPFSHPAVAVRRLFASWQPAVLARLLGAPAMHLVLVGLDAYTEEVALQVSRMTPLPGQGRTRLTFLVHDREAAAQELVRRFPALAELCRLDFRSFGQRGELAAADLQSVEDTRNGDRVTAVYVSAATDAEALMIARRLRVRTVQHRCWLAPIFVRLRRPEDAGGALQPIGSMKWLAQAIEPFGDIATSCSREALDDINDRRAQRVHEAYLAEARVAGSPRSAASLLPWTEIPEELRESNRRAVDHFALKLAALGFLLPQGAPRLAAPLALSSEELDALARFEHQSWSAEKLLAGWRPGQRRDHVRRIHEWLRPFEELGEARHRDLSQIEVLNTVLSQGPAAESAARERRIGLVGHNVLGEANARRVALAMHDLVRSLLDGPDGSARGPEVWSFVTPLGPGADLTLARAVTDALGAAGPPAPAFRFLIPQVLSFDQLAAAYLEAGPPAGAMLDAQSSLAATIERAGGEPARAVGQALRDFVTATPACRLVIDLPAPDPAVPAHRSQALAVVNGYLLEACDDLIAVLEPARYGVPGPFAAQAWRDVPEDRLPADGTGALVKAWLGRPRRQRLDARPPLFPGGLMVIEP